MADDKRFANKDGLKRFLSNIMSKKTKQDLYEIQELENAENYLAGAAAVKELSRNLVTDVPSMTYEEYVRDYDPKYINKIVNVTDRSTRTKAAAVYYKNKESGADSDVEHELDEINESLTAQDSSIFLFSYDQTSNQYGYTIGGVFHPFSNATKLYEALQYSGLVTSDMSFDQMCEALSNYFTPTVRAIIPRMTSNISPKGVCSASYLYGGRDAWFGFRYGVSINPNDAYTFWYTTASGQYSQYMFDKKYTVKNATLQLVSLVGSMKVEVQLLVDGNWVSAGTGNIASIGANVPYTMSIPFNKSYLADGIRFYNRSGEGGYAQMQCYGY